MLSAKSKKAAKWSSTDKLVSPLNLARCFKYSLGKLLSWRESCKATYLAWMIGWKLAILEDGDEFVEDDVDEYEFVGEDGGVDVGGGTLELLINGDWMTNFYSYGSNFPPVSNKGFV